MNSKIDCFHQFLLGSCKIGKPLIDDLLAKSKASPETITFYKAAANKPPNVCANM